MKTVLLTFAISVLFLLNSCRESNNAFVYVHEVTVDNYMQYKSFQPYDKGFIDHSYKDFLREVEEYKKGHTAKETLDRIRDCDYKYRLLMVKCGN